MIKNLLRVVERDGDLLERAFLFSTTIASSGWRWTGLLATGAEARRGRISPKSLDETSPFEDTYL